MTKRTANTITIAIVAAMLATGCNPPTSATDVCEPGAVRGMLAPIGEQQPPIERCDASGQWITD